MVWLGLIIKNLIAMFATKTMVIWGLKRAAKLTDNMVDDSSVELIEGLLDNDIEKVKNSIDKLILLKDELKGSK